MKSFYFIFFFFSFLTLEIHAQTTVILKNEAGEPVSARVVFDQLGQALQVDKTGTARVSQTLLERPRKVELINNKLYVVKDYVFDLEAHTLNITLSKKTYMFQATVFDAQNKRVGFGIEVVIESLPEVKPQETDDFGLVAWSIPKDQKITPQTRFSVNGILLPSANVKVSKTDARLTLNANQEIRFVDADQNPISEISVKFQEKTYTSDDKGIISIPSGKISKADISVTGYAIQAFEEKSKGWQAILDTEPQKTMERTQGDTQMVVVQDTVIEIIEDSVTVFVERDFSLILEGLEIEKQYLIESSTELRSKMEYLNERLQSNAITPDEQEGIRQYLLQLERRLIENELAYQEAQLRTHQVVEEMKRNLSMKDSLNEVTTERLETAEAEKEEVREEFRQNMFIATGIVAVIGIAAMILLVFYRKLERRRNELARVNGKLTETTSALQTKVEELDEERSKVEIQAAHLQVMNTEISDKNAKMLDSIRYAQTIQASILPSLFQMKRILPQFFILYKPKDIVSGDFYWFSHLMGKDGKGRTFIAVVDCTGHGVPGAFMSIVGNDLLNEIINQNGVHEPSKILTLLNIGIQKRFKQSEYLNNDAMDVSLCAIEKQEGKFVANFAGAKRPLYHYQAEQKTVRKLRGNLKSVGGNHKKKPTYNQEEFPLQEGDIIYLSTDGFADQNSPDRKKIGTKGLQDKLQDVATLSMRDQKKTLEDFLLTHQQESEQRDDITLLGVKF